MAMNAETMAKRGAWTTLLAGLGGLVLGAVFVSVFWSVRLAQAVQEAQRVGSLLEARTLPATDEPGWPVSGVQFHLPESVRQRNEPAIKESIRRLYRANKAERLNHVSQVVAELPFATSLEISDDSVTVGWNHERDDLAAFLVIRREGWTIGKATFRASGDPVVRPYD